MWLVKPIEKRLFHYQQKQLILNELKIDDQSSIKYWNLNSSLYSKHVISSTNEKMPFLLLAKQLILNEFGVDDQSSIKYWSWNR